MVASTLTGLNADCLDRAAHVSVVVPSLRRDIVMCSAGASRYGIIRRPVRRLDRDPTDRLASGAGCVTAAVESFSNVVS